MEQIWKKKNLKKWIKEKNNLAKRKKKENEFTRSIFAKQLQSSDTVFRCDLAVVTRQTIFQNRKLAQCKMKLRNDKLTGSGICPQNRLDVK